MPEETVLVDDLIDEIITPKHDLNEIEVFAVEYQQIPEFEPKEIVPQPELNFSENTTDIVPETNQRHHNKIYQRNKINQRENS